VATDFSAEIERLRHTYASIAAVTDPEALRSRIAELSEQASAPDLWDDPDSAQVVTSALSHAQADLKRVESLGERIEDLEAMVELAGEEEGEDAAEILAEAETDLAAISKDLSDLEIRTLLDGEYDERNAVITIRSGAGGGAPAAVDHLEDAVHAADVGAVDGLGLSLHHPLDSVGSRGGGGWSRAPARAPRWAGGGRRGG